MPEIPDYRITRRINLLRNSLENFKPPITILLGNATLAQKCRKLGIRVTFGNSVNDFSWKRDERSLANRHFRNYLYVERFNYKFAHYRLLPFLGWRLSRGANYLFLATHVARLRCVTQNPGIL